MFEQEIEMEKRQSAALPLLLIIALIVGLVGVSGYFLVQSRKVISPTDASQVVSDILKAQGPTTVSFHIGSVKERSDESVTDPRYRLLQKIGVIDIGKTRDEKTPVSLTAKGEELLKQIPGVTHSKEDDGKELLIVPLATRQLVQVMKVMMNGPERAAIQYSWKWQTNPIGENFDASGGKLSAFNTWDRIALIDKFGARSYQDPPVTVIVSVVKNQQGAWQIASE
jgi:hypothetical protein